MSAYVFTAADHAAIARAWSNEPAPIKPNRPPWRTPTFTIVETTPAANGGTAHFPPPDDAEEILLEPNRADINQHLYTLFRPDFVKAYPDAKIEIAWANPKTGGPEEGKWFSAFDLQAAGDFAEAQNRKGLNIYVGVALRQGEMPAKGRASKSHILTASRAWADFDDEGDDARVNAILIEKGIQAAEMVTTGTIPHRRFQVHFRLDGSPTAADLDAVNTALKTLLGGGDDVQNADRLMRLAGSVSYPPPKKVERGYIPELTKLQATANPCIYSTDTLIALAESTGTVVPFRAQAKGRSDRELEALLELSRTPGKWHNSIRNAIATMIGRGWSDSAIRLVCGPYCKAGAGDADLDDFINRARHKWDVPDTEQASGADDNADERVWPALNREALYGLAGEVVELIDPHTESDPVAILLQFLVWFGNAIGRGAYYQVEGDQHHTNLFGVLVGESSKSRKGTGAGRVKQLFKMMLEPQPEDAVFKRAIANLAMDWLTKSKKSGLASGEGLIWAIHDDVMKTGKDGFEVVEIKGIADKRLLVDEREFFKALAVMKREGNTLSPTIRDAWDGIDLQSLSKNSPGRASNPHISIIGHITKIELQQTLEHTSIANGFANRFLFACVKRSKILPHGGNLQPKDIEALAKRIKLVFDKSRTEKRIEMDPGARELWSSVYEKLSEGQNGMVAAITGRAEAQSIRLALIYAVLDDSERIRVAHLKAALALWQYCSEPALYIFGDSTGDPVADGIVNALRGGAMTRTQIRDLFKRHQSSSRIDLALETLRKSGRVRVETKSSGPGGGRPSEVWALATGGKGTC